MMIQDKIDFKIVFQRKQLKIFVLCHFLVFKTEKPFVLSSRLTNRRAIINTFLIWYGCHNTKLSINFGKYSLKGRGVTIMFTIRKGKLLLCMLQSVTKFTRIPFSWYLYRTATRAIPCILVKALIYQQMEEWLVVCTNKKLRQTYLVLVNYDSNDKKTIVIFFA